MTSGDDAIPHVETAALPPLPATPATERAPGAPLAPPPAGGVPADAQVGAPAAHEQIEHPIAAPHDVEVDAAVHDAAAHGSRIARAIEAAHAQAQAQAQSAEQVEPGSRAQVLGGAAASAANGQAYAPRESNRVDERDHDEHLDPLARIGGIDEDPHRRDPRSGEEQRRDDDPLPE